MKSRYPTLFHNRISEESLMKGFETEQLCRMQSIDRRTYPHLFVGTKIQRIIFDVGHNPPALVQGS
jgi:folylpolyglutamate synthase/dihydropteroate synthase